MGFTVSDLPGLFDSHAFVTASPEDRKDVLDNVLSQSFHAMTEQQGFDEEQYKQFGDIATAARQKLASIETTGEKIQHYAGVALDAAKSIASSIGAAGLDFSVMDENANWRLPLSNVVNGLGINIGMANDTAGVWAGKALQHKTIQPFKVLDLT